MLVTRNRMRSCIINKAWPNSRKHHSNQKQASSFKNLHETQYHMIRKEKKKKWIRKKKRELFHQRRVALKDGCVPFCWGKKYGVISFLFDVAESFKPLRLRPDVLLQGKKNKQLHQSSGKLSDAEFQVLFQHLFVFHRQLNFSKFVFLKKK